MRKSKSFDSLYILHAFEGEKKQKKTGLMFFPPKKVVFFAEKKKIVFTFSFM
jgi:hypothetical protein